MISESAELEASYLYRIIKISKTHRSFVSQDSLSFSLTGVLILEVLSAGETIQNYASSATPPKRPTADIQR